MFEIRDV